MIKKLLLLSMGLAMLAACAPKGPNTAADEAALRADPLAWMEAYNAGNSDGIASLYTEDAILLPPGAPPVVGRAAIREFVVPEMQKAKDAGLTNKCDAVTGVGVSGDLGWLSGNYIVTDGSGATVDKGKFLSVYRRDNGDWQLIRDTWNSDMPAAPVAPPAPGAAADPAAAPPK